MGSDFASRIQATRHALTGIIEFIFDGCALETEDDVYDFFTAFRQKLDVFPAPRDCVICLDGLQVAPDVRPLYSHERASIARTCYRYSARYAGSPVIRIAVLTSAIRYQADATLYETREEAFAAILMRRGPGES